MTRIAHLTSVHTRTDTRVFKKQCRSLAKRGFEVFLVVADGLGDEQASDVHISDVGASKSRLSRILFAPLRVFMRALKLRAQVYHLHDPELLPVGILLRLAGRKVIFDAHENFRKQLLSKPYLGKWQSRLFSRLVAPVEFVSFKFFHHIITATPSIKAHIGFIKESKITVVNNFPLLEEFSFSDAEKKNNGRAIFVGAITRIRGLQQLIDALPQRQSFHLDLIGGCSDKNFLAEMEAAQGWGHVTYHGFLSANEAFRKVENSLAGIVTYLPYANHIEAQPNKLFEYMAAGVPVIASHFPLWRDIVEGNGTGICVDPESPQEIADALAFLADNPEKAKAMGQKGRAIVKQKFNWQAEEEALAGAYEKLLG